MLHKNKCCILVAVVRAYHCHYKNSYVVSELHQKLFTETQAIFLTWVLTRV